MTPTADGLSTRWFGGTACRGMHNARLFCLPHAGSLGYTFVSWQKRFSPTVEVVNVHLPGRSPRHAEPSYRRMEPLVTALSRAMLECTDLPFVIFGHSLGALIAYELALSLERHGHPPMNLVLSGCGAPLARRHRKQLHTLPDAELLDEIHALDGTPKEVFANGELSRMLLPLLRADLELAETYNAQPVPPLRCPIVALGGMDDQDVTEDEILAWSGCTAAGFSQHVLPGGHFFIRTAENEALKIIRQVVEAS